MVAVEMIQRRQRHPLCNHHQIAHAFHVRWDCYLTGFAHGLKVTSFPPTSSSELNPKPKTLSKFLPRILRLKLALQLYLLRDAPVSYAPQAGDGGRSKL
jgi:hypothetical protein